MQRRVFTNALQEEVLLLLLLLLLLASTRLDNLYDSHASSRQSLSPAAQQTCNRGCSITTKENRKPAAKSKLACTLRHHLVGLRRLRVSSEQTALHALCLGSAGLLGGEVCVCGRGAHCAYNGREEVAIAVHFASATRDAAAAVNCKPLHSGCPSYPHIFKLLGRYAV